MCVLCACVWVGVNCVCVCVEFEDMVKLYLHTHTYTHTHTCTHTHTKHTHQWCHLWMYDGSMCHLVEAVVVSYMAMEYIMMCCSRDRDNFLCSHTIKVWQYYVEYYSVHHSNTQCLCMACMPNCRGICRKPCNVIIWWRSRRLCDIRGHW